MVVSPNSVWETLTDVFETEHRNAVVHADFEQETILHEGAVRIRTNGWVELPSGRLLSPESVHHIDTDAAQRDAD